MIVDNTSLTNKGTLGIIGLEDYQWRLITVVKQLGLNVYLYLDHHDQQLEQWADQTIVDNYRVKESLQKFGQQCDAVIYTNPLLDAVILKYLTQFTTVPQGYGALEIVQDRIVERALLDQLNVNMPPYDTVVSLDEVYQSIDAIGYPAVLKSIQRGRGESILRLNLQTDIARADAFIQAGSYILESWIDNSAEYALTVAYDGENFVYYPIVQETYDDQRRLVMAKVVEEVDPALEGEVERVSREVITTLGYQGTLTLKFYTTESGNLYVDEIVPGLSISNVALQAAVSVMPEEQLVRMAVGMVAHQVDLLQEVVMVPIYEAQQATINQAVLEQADWQVEYLPAPLSSVQGFVWLTGDEPANLIQQLADLNLTSQPTDE